jgi:hypothetical protein
VTYFWIFVKYQTSKPYYEKTLRTPKP